MTTQEKLANYIYETFEKGGNIILEEVIRINSGK